MLALSCGISGSGKSFYGQRLQDEHNFVIVCPDDLREQITGDVSVMSQDDIIWKKAFELTRQYLNEGKNVYFSATNLKHLAHNLIKLKGALVDTPVLIMFFGDSKNLELCKIRVRSDLDLGKKRSNVPEEVLEKQFQRYAGINRKELLRVINENGLKSVVIEEDQNPFINFDNLVHVMKTEVK